VGFVLVLVTIINAVRNGKPAGDNPWGALTLEWQSPSPPPHENFHHNPVVTEGPYEYRGEKALMGSNA